MSSAGTGSISSKAITKLKVGNLPSNGLAWTNKVYVAPQDMSDYIENHYKSLGIESLRSSSSKSYIVLVQGHPYEVEAHNGVPAGHIALNGLQRRYGQLSLNSPVRIGSIEQPYYPPPPLSSIVFSVDTLSKKPTQAAQGGRKPKPKGVDTTRLANAVLNSLGSQVFEKGQIVALDFQATKLELVVHSVSSLADVQQKKGTPTFSIGQLSEPTNITFRRQDGTISITLEGDHVAEGEAGGGAANNIFLNDFDFEKLGIGGLDSEFNQIFRRAFASRIWPPSIIKQMGINHVRGMLLYGPPGCGKTLIARQIGKALNAREPKIVNGPEILNKYVGGSEEKIRELFKDAEKEQLESGDSSMLHIVIMDEMDAICKQRGTVKDGTGVQDSVVNQLLSKIDGVDSLNNILLIGMTNRKDMIDDALLRPGRLEVHVEIGLPDVKGRLQILNIHTRNMKKANRITDEVISKLPEIATKTKNYSGAEIEGLVKAASSYALTRCVDVNDLKKAPDTSKLKLQYDDFQLALNDIEPKFGSKSQELKAYYSRNGFISYSESFELLMLTLTRLVEQVRRADTRTPLMSVLLRGPPSAGKTAIGAKIAVDSLYPFVRMISADEMIGYSEVSKCQMIHKVFMDSYKSQLSIIFIDDIERIIDYVPIGPRFSNTVLQTLLVLLKKIPPTDEDTEQRRLLVIGTTSIPHLLEDLGLVQAFNVSQSVPLLEDPNEIATVLHEAASLSPQDAKTIAITMSRQSNAGNKPIGIKQLLMVAEMSQQQQNDEDDNNNNGGNKIDPSIFMECLHSVGY